MRLPPFPRSSLSIVAATAALLLAVGGCASLQSTDDNLLGFVTPYRVEVVQGNVVTREQAAAVRVGMSRTQVRDIFGTPLLADIFHADRWDYVFTIRRQGTEPQQRRVELRFDGETLKSISGTENLPGELEFVASIDAGRTSSSRVRKLALTDDELRALPAPQRRTAPAPEPVGAVRSYPPLEPR